jgi:AsmA-like protein
LLNVRDFIVKGEASLDKLAAGGPVGAQAGISFTRLRAEFSRQNGQLTIKEGVLKGPAIGGTIEGSIDYPGNQVRMSGTFVPVYGLNNLLNQIPVAGLFFGGSNEGVFGLTYEVVGTPDKPTLRVNPVSMIFPGISRKIMEFNTGKQNGQVEFPAN